MSANRKLQSEIQQVLKKVEEGVALFDDIWGKVYAAEQQSLKEKYEADLKKEIKKLQRLRDQIKSWLSSTEIKDKSQLTELRKIIETKMEQFKVCEKDTKTKAYSKEGLAREARLDPKEAEREDKRNWANDCLDRLNDIVNLIEADIEKLSGGRAKSKNKEQLEKFENRIKKNKWHIARLEQIIKLLDNEELDPSRLDVVKDDVEYYIETAVDDDGALGIDDEFDIYEDLQLDAVSLKGDKSLLDADATEVSSDSINDDSVSAVTEVVEPESSEDKKISPKKVTPAVIPPVSRAPVVKAQPVKSTISAIVNQPATKRASSPPPQATAAATATAATTTTTTAAALGNVGKTDSKASVSSAPSSVPKPTSESEGGVSSSWASLASQKASSAKVAASPASASASNISVNVSSTAAAAVTQPASAPQAVSQVAPSTTSSSASSASTSQASVSNPQPLPQPVPVVPIGQAPAAIGQQPLDSSSTAASQPATTAAASKIVQNATAPYQQPLEGISSAGAKPSGEPVNPTNLMMRYSLMYHPESFELDKQSSYVPKNAFPTHASFPAQPLYFADNVAFVDKLPMDSLFLSFYYQQGTYQQYLAAKRLKQLSWRFHKKYMTWFQRHEEPKRTTDSYEEGTYVYFDYESGWCQRIKSEFKFEYAYLEDELVASQSS